VAPGGYAWWYIDALSDDGRHGLTLIAFIGSVFSPYYAWARRHGEGDPINHCALNVALYGAAGKRWSLTERGRAALAREARSLTIGPSSLAWNGSSLEIHIDEVTAPIPSRIRGTVRLHPEALTERSIALDGIGHHRWHPMAPCARVEVNLDKPALGWSGQAYFDSNTGDLPLEQGFSRWDWSRTNDPQGTCVLYDVTRRNGETMSMALRFDPGGGIEEFEPPAAMQLPSTRWWRIARRTQSDAGQPVRVLHTLEDTPFYARSVLASQLRGEPVTAMHESLSLDRFRAGWVQMLLPFRMPRRRR
jgi:carotenoid 1,2-hydratase